MLLTYITYLHYLWTAKKLYILQTTLYSAPTRKQLFAANCQLWKYNVVLCANEKTTSCVQKNKSWTLHLQHCYITYLCYLWMAKKLYILQTMLYSTPMRKQLFAANCQPWKYNVVLHANEKNNIACTKKIKVGHCTYNIVTLLTYLCYLWMAKKLYILQTMLCWERIIVPLCFCLYIPFYSSER